MSRKRKVKRRIKSHLKKKQSKAKVT